MQKRRRRAPSQWVHHTGGRGSVSNVVLCAAMSARALAVELGEFVAGLRFETLPPAVVDKAKAVVNHAVTVGMAGFREARSEAARRAVLAHERLGTTRIGAGQGATLW